VTGMRVRSRCRACGHAIEMPPRGQGPAPVHCRRASCRLRHRGNRRGEQ
jgi:hypothetical protein